MRTSKKLHFVMFPWFAYGHFTPFLHLSNRLAQRGHTISFLLPHKASIHLHTQNLHPDLITFYPLNVPAVNGLPSGAQTASDVPLSSHTYLARAFDLTRGQVEDLVVKLAPDFIFHDFSHWLPEFASSMGITTVKFIVIAAICFSIGFEKALSVPGQRNDFGDAEFGEGITFEERINAAFARSDAVCFRTCNDIEGKYVGSLRKMCNKPIFVAGPILPEEEGEGLEPQWDNWLSRFEPRTVIFCALGTQIVLEKPKFQELVLGFELTGLPFLLVLKPPVGATSLEEALPEGFEERVKDRGVVYDGWVQQSLVLKHASIGCFVTHCGYGSMWESLVNECQIVGLPFLPDQVLNAELLADDLKAAVAVEREKNGWVSKEKLCEAIKSVMDEGSEVGLEVKRNHLKYREILSKEGYMGEHVDKLVEDLQELKASTSGMPYTQVPLFKKLVD